MWRLPSGSIESCDLSIISVARGSSFTTSFLKFSSLSSSISKDLDSSSSIRLNGMRALKRRFPSSGSGATEGSRTGSGGAAGELFSSSFPAGPSRGRSCPDFLKSVSSTDLSILSIGSICGRLAIFVSSSSSTTLWSRACLSLWTATTMRSRALIISSIDALATSCLMSSSASPTALALRISLKTRMRSRRKRSGSSPLSKRWPSRAYSPFRS